MGRHDFSNLGNRPVNSTSAPTVAGSTSTLFAELDSTMLGTKDFLPSQSRLYDVTWIVGADSTCTWQLESCSDTALANGQDRIFPKTAAGVSAQFNTVHVLEKDWRLRARQASSAASGAAYISAVPL